MKKLLCLLIAVILVLPSTVFAASSFDNTDFSFSNGTLTIYGNGAMIDFTTAPWRSFADDVIEVVIESGITSIGANSFSGLKNLSSVSVPSTVTSIGRSAFYGTTSLKSISLPSSLSAIGDGAFRKSGIMAVSLPESLSLLGSFAFEGCETLSIVSVGDKLDMVGENAFANTAWLNAQTEAQIYLGNIFYRFNSSNSSVVLDSSTRGIAGKAFAGTSVSSVTLNEGLEFIGPSAFSGCKSLSGIALPSSLKNLSYAAFAKSGLVSINLPSGIASLDGTFSGCEMLTSINLGSVTDIGDFAFYGCSSLTSIALPFNLERIGSYAFAKSGLAQLDTPSSLNEIGAFAFYGCELLQSIFLGDGLAIIGEASFSACSSLYTITIPKSVQLIGSYAFAGCKTLGYAIFSGNTVEFGRNVFTNSNPTLCGSPESSSYLYAIASGLSFRAVGEEYSPDALFVKQGATGIGSQSNPLGSLDVAINLLDGKGGIIYIIDDYLIKKINASSWQEEIEIVGASDSSSLVIEKNIGITFKGPVAFKNITIAGQTYSHIDNSSRMVFDLGYNNICSAIVHVGSHNNSTTGPTTTIFKSGVFGGINAFGAYATNPEAAVVNGDMYFEISGGSLPKLLLCADKYNDAHTGMTVNGNVTFAISSHGTLGFAKNTTTAPTINGAVNFIFEDAPIPTGFECPTARDGGYIIKASSGGKVLATQTAGQFSLVPDSGMQAVVNGQATDALSITLASGTHTVEFVKKQPQAETVCYVSSTAADGGSGTLDSPFNKLETAINSFGGKDGTIIVIGEYNLSSFNHSGWNGMVVVTGYDSDSRLTLVKSSGVLFRGDIELRNITMMPGSSSHLNPLKKLVLNLGEENSFQTFMHLGAFSNYTVDAAHTSIESGNYNLLYAFGGYSSHYAHGINNDALLEVNGGKVTRIVLSADRYMDNQTGITVGGNANIIINGGEVGSIAYNSVTAPQILGALNIIFNNDTASKLTGINYPSAAGGVFYITSGIGGKVLPTDKIGEFLIEPLPGYVPIINGTRTSGGIVSLPTGKIDITWARVTEYNTEYELTLDKETLTLPINARVLLGSHTSEPFIDHKHVWSSSNTAVATVAGGAVVGHSAGTAVITAKSPDGVVSASCSVTVVDKSVSLKKLEITRKNDLGVSVAIEIDGSRAYGKLCITGFDKNGAVCDTRLVYSDNTTVTLSPKTVKIKAMIIDSVGTMKPLCEYLVVQ